MKLFISADLEGISGIVSNDQVSSKGYDYGRARKLMTDEVNSAIAGAIKFGVEDIVVNDSHGPMTNLLIEELDSRAYLITGSPKKLGMMEGINKEFDAVVFVGYHARMNTPGVLSHSFDSSVISNISVNGVDMGEFGMNALLAGHFEVPVVLVTGDNILAREVKELEKNIETIVVKNANSRYASKCINPKLVHKMIADGVQRGLNSIKNIPCVSTDNPIILDITFINSGMAETASIMPKSELITPNTIRYKADNALEAYRARMAITNLASNI